MAPPAHLPRCTRRHLVGRAAAVGACALLPGSLLTGCTRTAPDDGKIHLTYWEKWERFEREAIRRVVDDFNASQDRIVVHMHTFGSIDKKILTATAGMPARSTLFYALYLWAQAFEWLHMGYACAMAWILFIIVVILTLIAHRTAARRITYLG